MKIITEELANVTGGLLATTNVGTTTPTPGSSSSSSLALQTAMSNLTSDLDRLKNTNNNSFSQLLPVAIMAKWIRNQNG